MYDYQLMAKLCQSVDMIEGATWWESQMNLASIEVKCTVVAS